MTKLTVTLLKRKNWQVDLRPYGFGRRAVTGVPALPEFEGQAIHEAYALLFRLTGGHRAQSPATETPAAVVEGGGGGPPGETLDVAARTLDGACKFKFACDRFAAQKEFTTEGGEDWGEQYLDLVRRELGNVVIAAFERRPRVQGAPTGFEVLRGYRDDLQARGLGPKTRSNRLNIIRQVLEYAVGEGWLLSLPKIPSGCATGETLINPSWDWISEPDFRALRAEIGGGNVQLSPTGRCLALRDRASADDMFARRRLYLSFAFYWGYHTKDLDELTSEGIGVDTGRYMRKNSKSSKYVKRVPLEMPEQLQLDIDAELSRLGRRWRPLEKIAGGRWQSVARGLRHAVERVNARRATEGGKPIGFCENEFEQRERVEVANLRVFRRSCARMYALMGWPERDISEVLGHVDQRMIREVYVRVPVHERSPLKVPWTVENSKLPWLSMRKPKRILPFERQPSLFAADDE